MKRHADTPPPAVGSSGPGRDLTARQGLSDELWESETRFRSLADDLPEIIDRFDRRFRHLYVNPAGARLHGVAPEQLVGRTIRETGVTEPFAGLWERRLRKVFKSARPLEVSDAFPTPDGLRHFESRCHPEFDAQRRVRTVLVVSRDITERKRLETTLSNESDLYKDLVATAPIGVYRVRVMARRPAGGRHSHTLLWRRFKFELTSDTFCRIVGVTQAQCEANVAAVEACIHPDDRAGFTQANAEGIKKRTTFNWEGRILKNRTVRWVQFRSIPRPLGNGDVVWTGIVLDITERKQAEEQLRESEARFRGVFEQAADSIVVFDPDTTRILEFNDAACQHLGYTRNEFAKLSIADLDIVESTADVVRHGHRVMTHGHRVFETRHRAKSGTICDVEVWPKAIRLGGRTVIVAIWRDITERKRIEATLRKREADLTALFEGSTEPILMLNKDCRITRANAAIGKMMGVASQDLVGRSPTELLPSKLAQARMRRLRQTLRSGQPQRFEDERNGRVMENVIYPVKGADGGVEGVAVLVHDLTGHKQLQDQLKATNDGLEAKVKERTARLRSLAAELTQAENKERRRIAHLLHEDLQQRLVAMKYKTEGLMHSGGDRAATETAKSLTDALDGAIQLTRTLTSRLAPPVLYELGLRPSLEWLAGDMQRQYGLSVSVTGHRSFQLPTDEMQVFAFDAVRELLVNVHKHAGVRSAEIRIRAAGRKRISVAVCDRGKGMSENCERGAHFGLFSIRERAGAMGSGFTLSSGRGKGTCATLTLPTL